MDVLPLPMLGWMPSPLLLADWVPYNSTLLVELRAVAASEDLLYVNQAGSSESLSPASLELDTVVLGLVLLTTAHAILHRRLLRLILYTLVGAFIEQVAVRVGGTHCHAEALVMLSQCVSLCSVAVYAAALYACQLTAARLPLHAFARPFAIGLLVCAHTAPHLLQGADQGWWTWQPPFPSELADAGDAVAAAGSEALSSSSSSAAGAVGPSIALRGTPMWTYHAFGLSHAIRPSIGSEALALRAFHVPIVALVAAAGLGIGLGTSEALRAILVALLSPRPTLWWCLRWPIQAVALVAATGGGVLGGAVAAYMPTGVVLPSLLSCGVSQPAALAAILLLLAVPLLLLPPSSRTPGHAHVPPLPRTDALLFAIPLWQVRSPQPGPAPEPRPGAAPCASPQRCCLRARAASTHTCWCGRRGLTRGSATARSCPTSTSASSSPPRSPSPRMHAPRSSASAHRRAPRSAAAAPPRSMPRRRARWRQRSALLAASAAAAWAAL